MNQMLRRGFVPTMLLVIATTAHAQGTRLLRHPAVRGNNIVVAYASDLWVTTRTGGAARRITSTPDVESDPQFSPDGSMIAFSRTAAGNTDVYVVPTAGGTPRRLTCGCWSRRHPSECHVRRQSTGRGPD
jgi:tricorn protease